MSRFRAAALFGMLLFFGGCGPVNSLFPLFLDSDKVLDQNLIGEWREVPEPNEKPSTDDENTRWFFAKDEDGLSYNLTISVLTKGASGQFNAKLVRLGDALFVDFAHGRQSSGSSGSSEFASIAGHMIGRIRVDKNEIRTSLLDGKWISDEIKKGSFALAHVDTPDEVVLSAPTEDLRKFVAAHAEDKEAFSDEFSLSRVN